MEPLVVAQLASTWAMFGVIWFVQLVQYPGFAKVDPGSFQAFHAHHTGRITLIVAPLMLVELGSALWLVFDPPGGWPTWVPAGGLVLVLAAWVSTATLQVPAHARLSEGYDEATARGLVQSNWLRTLIWTTRAALLTWAVVR